MARTDRFREQHDELLSLAKQLKAQLNAAQLAQDGSTARTALAKLMGKLTLHLSAEDRVLYPELAGHRDPTVAAIAKRFASEMKDTAKAVTSYNQKWATPSSIKANPSDFIKETDQVLKVLADRIRRENTEFYAAADRTEGANFA